MADDLTTQLGEDLNQAINAGEYDAEIDALMATVADYWISISPEDSGDYKRSIGVITPAESGKGRVGATEGYGNIIEFGSADTPEFAPRQRTVDYFNTGRPAT